MELFWWGIFADCTMGKSHLNRHLGYYLGTFASILCKSKFGWPWLGKSIVKNHPLVRRIFILIRVSVCPWVWFNDLFWLLGGSLKWWGETPTTISFPTKNDQHLGNEVGGNPPFKETPISFCRMVVGWSLGCQYPVKPSWSRCAPLRSTQQSLVRLCQRWLVYCSKHILKSQSLSEDSECLEID